ncbi:MAG: sigma 54-interacting transcriptional regulator [candidate division Zixibacteria bacterium]|nr:sigma 54-interacting transcriptional regulator [candidate division Zixibacteria bacterium]
MTAKVLTTTEQLLRNSEYASALSSLEALDASLLSSRDYGFYCILLTEANAYLGTYDERFIDEAVEIFRHSVETEMFARAKYAKGWLLSLQGMHADAKQVLLEAYANYLRCGKKHKAGLVLNRLAYGSLQTGNTQSAVENLENAIRIYEEIGDNLHQTRFAINLAGVLWSSGRLTESLSVFSEYGPSVSASEEKLAVVFFYNSAIPYALKGDIKEARRRIAKCKPYLDKYPREKAIYFENLGWINILDGKYAAAEKALKEGLELSLTIAPESALISQNKRLFGDLYIATEKYDLAEKFASEALVVAEKINERVEIAACWRIFAQVAQHRSEEAQAREWFDKAIDLFNLIGTRYELAVARYLAAASGLYSKSERTAMLYMAREYFEAEGITPFIAKVETQLSRQPSPVNVDKRSDGCPNIITVNDDMKKLLDLAEHVAQSEMTVFLTGDTGTGKDLLARYLHFCSGRKGEFVTVNAAAIPNPMIEAELFGHTKGAFTSAEAERKGLLELADKGTFYLNEIADATPEFQAKLLEVLETREVRKLGSNKSKKVNFRLIAATNHDLKARMHDGHFRVDLYHRLNEIPLTLPPLSARTEDIAPLVQHFLKEAGFTANGDGADHFAAVLALQEYPGNVRELQARVKQLVTVGKNDIDRMIALAKQSGSERERTLKALESCDWNRREAALLLGVSEATVRRRIEKYALTQPVTD